MRQKWAEGWARRIKEGGALIALAFPVTDPNPSQTSPPFPVQLEDYQKVLEPQGFTCISELPVAPENATTPAREGKEILTVWMKVK